MTTGEVRRELEREHLEYELIPHDRTMSAGEEAAVLGVPPDEIAKTIVLATEEGYVRAVLPASERLDVHKAQEVVGDRKARLATEAELAAAYPTFELGAVPPFGGAGGDRVLVDRRLAGRETVVLEAGSHSESIRMKTSDLLQIAAGEIADLCTT